MTNDLLTLGGSTAAGIGVDGRSYAVELAEAYGLEPRSLAMPRRLISYSLENLDEICALDPSLILLQHGVSDLVVTLRPGVLRLLPASWRGQGGLEPPLRSRQVTGRPLRRQLKIEVKLLTKGLALTVAGGWAPYQPQTYGAALDALVTALLERTSASLLLVSPGHVDRRRFPRTSRNYAAALESSRVLGQRLAHTGRVGFVDVQAATSKWSDYLADRWHLSQSGHAKVAQACAQELTARNLLRRGGSTAG
jgi:hypothetical protein